MTDPYPKRTTRPLRYLELINDHIESLRRGQHSDVSGIATIVKDELESARSGVEAMAPGEEKTEKLRQIEVLEKKFSEWEKGRQKPEQG